MLCFCACEIQSALYIQKFLLFVQFFIIDCIRCSSTEMRRRHKACILALSLIACLSYYSLLDTSTPLLLPPQPSQPSTPLLPPQPSQPSTPLLPLPPQPSPPSTPLLPLPPQPSPPSQTSIKNNIHLTLQYLHFHPPSANHWEHVSTTTSLMSYYAPSPDVIYTGVPKAGCTNLKYTILKQEPLYSSMIDRPGPKVHYLMNFLAIGYQNRERSKWLYLNSKFSFTVIRNPWTRMVSGYVDKIQSRVMWQNGEASLNILNVYRRKVGEGFYRLEDLQEGVKPTFLEFLQYLADLEVREMNDHFKPQYKMLGLLHVKYDYVGALEHAEIQSKEIMKHFRLSPAKGVPISGPYDSTHDPRLESSTLLAKKWFSSVPQDLVDKLYNKYKPDFMIYNYSNFTHPLFPFPLP